MMTTLNEATVASAQTSNRPYLAWPPPGLEPLQGVLWTLLRSFVPGAVLFALPLLLAIATDQDFWSLGPFGDSFWVPVLTSMIALAVLFDAAIRLARALRVAAHGAQLGFELRTMIDVAADGSRDAGFVLQGARAFSALSPADRERLLLARRVAPLSYVAAALWLPAALSLAVLFAYLGVVGDFTIWMVTIVPALLLALTGTIARQLEARLTRQAQKKARSEADKLHEELSNDARLWRHNRDLLTNTDDKAQAANARALKWSAGLALAPAVVLVLPVIAILGATIMGPVLAGIAVPRFGTTERKLKAVELYSAYLLPPDSSITAQRAGEAVVNISHAGGQTPARYLRPATIALGALPDPLRNPIGPDVSWTDSILELHGERRMTAQQRQFVRTAAAHGVHAEFSVLARAAGIDFAGTRWVSPLPDSVMMYELPVPKFGLIRETAYLHAVKALDEFMDGRSADAEHTMKEIITAGYRMTQDGPTLIDALIGSVIANLGALHLEKLYRAMGRTAEANEVKARIDAKNLLTETTAWGAESTSSTFAGMVQAVRSEKTSRALSWELFMVFNTSVQCLNLRNTVFPQDPAYEQWVNAARARLVKYPADSALFERARRGILAGGGRGACGVPFRLLSDL